MDDDFSAAPRSGADVEAGTGSRTARALTFGDAAVVIADERGLIQFWSEGAERLFGYARDRMIGERVAVIVPDEFHARHFAGWGRAWKEGDFSVGAPIMIPVRCADGQTRRFASQLSPVRAPHGQLVAVMAVWTPPSDADAGVRPLL